MMPYDYNSMSKVHLVEMMHDRQEIRRAHLAGRAGAAAAHGAQSLGRSSTQAARAIKLALSNAAHAMRF